MVQNMKFYNCAKLINFTQHHRGGDVNLQSFCNEVWPRHTHQRLKTNTFVTWPAEILWKSYLFFRKVSRWAAEKGLWEGDCFQAAWIKMSDTGGWRCRRCRRPWYAAVRFAYGGEASKIKAHQIRGDGTLESLLTTNGKEVKIGDWWNGFLLQTVIK